MCVNVVATTRLGRSKEKSLYTILYCDKHERLGRFMHPGRQSLTGFDPMWQTVCHTYLVYTYCVYAMSQIDAPHIPR